MQQQPPGTGSDLLSMSQPVATRDQVLEVLNGLLAESVTRESGASWASARHAEQYPDPDVEEALAMPGAHRRQAWPRTRLPLRLP